MLNLFSNKTWLLQQSPQRFHGGLVFPAGGNDHPQGGELDAGRGRFQGGQCRSQVHLGARGLFLRLQQAAHERRFVVGAQPDETQKTDQDQENSNSDGGALRIHNNQYNR